MSASSPQIGQLITAHRNGQSDAFERLMDVVYDDLREIAHRQLQREATGHTLRTTALVHEAYLRLASSEDLCWRDRAHFFAVASGVMRHILVDHARRRAAKRRGGDRIRVERETLPGDPGIDLDLLALDEALTELTDHHARMGQVVELRFFGGLTREETAEVLDVSVRTVERDWTRARAYLYDRLADFDRRSGPDSVAS